MFPIAGFLLGIDASHANEAAINAYNLTQFFGKGTILNNILSVTSSEGEIIFGNIIII